MNVAPLGQSLKVCLNLVLDKLRIELLLELFLKLLICELLPDLICELLPELFLELLICHNRIFSPLDIV